MKFECKYDEYKTKIEEEIKEHIQKNHNRKIKHIAIEHTQEFIKKDLLLDDDN